jgi:hypothetical protein
VSEDNEDLYEDVYYMTARLHCMSMAFIGMVKTLKSRDSLSSERGDQHSCAVSVRSGRR